MKVDTGEVYERVRQAFIGTCRGLRTEQWSVHVPASPRWTVHDVLSHVVGLCADLNALHFPEDDDLGGEAWNQRQVDSRVDRSPDDLVREWEHAAPVFERGLTAFGYEFGSHFVADLHAHLHDVREALGLDTDADPTAVTVSLDHYLDFVGESLRHRHWGSLEVIAGTASHTIGHGATRARVAAPAYEVLRALSARRSLRAIRAFEWSGEVDAAIEALQTVYHGGYAFPED